VATGQAFRTLYNPAPDRGFGSVRFHAGGRLLVAADPGAGIRLWDLSVPRPLALLPGASGPFLFEQNGNALLTHSSSDVLRWPLRLIENDGHLVVHVGPPTKLDCANGKARTQDERDLEAIRQGRALSPDGKWVATGSWHSDGAKVWDAQNGKLVRHLTNGDASVCFSPDGKWLVTGTNLEYVIREVGSWRTAFTFERKRGYLNGVMAFSPDTTVLAFANCIWNDVQLIETATGRQLASLPNPDAQYISGLTFSPDGSQLAVNRTPMAAGPGWISQLHLVDLRSIRRQLAEMKLDWHLPSYPARTPRHTSPIRVEVTATKPAP
jgi:WD40 repeat protein